MANQATLELIMAAKDNASDNLKQVEGSLSSLGGTAAKVAAGGLAAGAAAIAAVGGAALNFSQDVDSAMRTFQAQTGASTEELDQFEDVAMDVFAAGWGESVDQVTQSMGQVHRALGQTGDALRTSTEQAMILSETFGIDVTEGANMAAAAVDSGLVQSSEEAFDLITTGFQEGLDRADDFGDTIQEYSSDFSRLGFTAEDVLNTINAGMEAGAYNTDVVADGIREFGIRFTAAEENAVGALESIGVNTESLYAQYEAGEITTADAMRTITGALGNVESKTLRAQAGAALFGSKWEDIGEDVFLAAGQAEGGIEDITGATDEAGRALRRGFGPAMKELKRTALVAIKPIGDLLGGLLTNLVDKWGPPAQKWLEEFSRILEAFITGAPSDFPWEDIFPSWIADRMYDISKAFEAIQEGDWQGVRDNIVNFFQGAWDDIKTKIDWQKLGKDIVDLLIRGITDTAIQIGKFTGKLWDKIEEIDWKTVGQNVAGAVKRGVNTAVVAVTPFVKKLSTQIRETNWQQVGQDVVQAVSRGLAVAQIPTNLMRQSFMRLFDRVKQSIAEINWAPTFVRIGENMAAGIINLRQTVGKGLLRAVTGATKNIENVDWESVGKRVVTFIGDAIKLAVGILVGAVLILFGMGKEQATTGEGAGIWTDLGKAVIGLFAAGIKASFAILTGAAKAIGKAAVEAIANIEWGQLGEDIITWIQGGLTAVTDTIVEVASGIGSSIEEAFTDIDWGALGTSIIDGIKGGINAAAGKLAEAAKGAAQSAYQGAKGTLGIKCPEPSPLFADLGIAMGEGISSGLAQMEKQVSGRVGSIVDPREMRGVSAGGARRPTRRVTNNQVTNRDTIIVNDRTAMAMLMREKRDRELRQVTGGV